MLSVERLWKDPPEPFHGTCEKNSAALLIVESPCNYFVVDQNPEVFERFFPEFPLQEKRIPFLKHRAFPGPSSLNLPKGGPGRAILASLTEPCLRKSPPLRVTIPNAKSENAEFGVFKPLKSEG